ncbi:MAG TPA: TonB-dependent receptor, partial [Ignavibacteriaceae bacterium]|nr:TonB-dependent receptor [Ignavibacteriaceae bacterium]
MRSNFSPTFLIFFAILLFTANLFPQNNGILRGFVTDSLTGKTLAFGNVFLPEINLGASTNDRGLYLIKSIPANYNYKVLISYVGYETKELNVFIRPNEITQLDVSLKSLSIELQTIEKTGEKVIEKNSTNLGLLRLTIREIEALPKGVETDLLRSLQYLPGVQSTGDVSAKYYVRGSTSDQNLVLINNIIIYNPFHSLGLFSVIDPEMINNVEFYKGAFTSEFG